MENVHHDQSPNWESSPETKSSKYTANQNIPGGLNQSNPQNAKKGKASIGHKFKNWATNLNFKLDNYVQTVELDIPLVYLGKEYRTNMKNFLDQHIRETIWFSYREKMPAIMPETFTKKAITCDRGWGCMIRCGQMMLAEGIKRHYQFQGKLLEEIKEESLLTIISLFADFIKEAIIAPFSIQQLCRVAYENFGSKPGEWYRASSVMMGLDILNETHGQRRIKDFRMCIFKEGTVYEDQIFAKAYKTVECSPDEKVKEIGENNVEETKEKNEEQQKKEHEPLEEAKGEPAERNNENSGEGSTQNNRKWTNSMLVFIATKTGLSKHNVLYLPTILRLLKFPQSIGILGGKDTKGYYFLGFQGSSLLYLDPHYVQESCKNFADFESKFESFFRKKFFQVDIDDIDTSIGFGFYIANEEDYNNFKLNLNTAIQRDPNFLIGFQEITPTINVKEGDIIEIDGLGDNIFEVIS